MKITRKPTLYTLLTLAVFLLYSCGEKTTQDTNTNQPPSFENKGHELVYYMVKKVGDYQTLASKKDVTYTYTYTTPDGKSDISTEKYIFDGELSYGLYQQHERTLPELNGPIEQGYDGQTFWLKHNGKLITDTTALKRVAFNRPTNFYWFAMFQKLLDPRLNYEFIGEQSIESNNYNVVKITFDQVGDKVTDTYQLYINKETNLVDQFLFTVADFGVIEEPYLMQLAYEPVADMLIPTKRKYKPSDWNANVTDAPWITVNWTNIQFDNGLEIADFKK
ncbi:DUF6503 family protein [Roseivirga pacifica]|uniref:DUF6503 family protein n=1 Tax=Roseivirga pacifica TaxID=1267423 RepID=UPI0020965243|nr:DUF6503 family protein [Roseivirga pacifica]MCO6359931.1 hypothetical protein [Roseivirga pacifica]MCO6367301.1 hypothetical protein [Roseivirga pacifica]MCO6370167.1 hypothetical protein [Roseivirga pacifica]MCO6374958.1 hypothetical protein [Roseivirga pacifica]MCO6380216.1 hypothetical protein [Roseivirga pacifica]